MAQHLLNELRRLARVAGVACNELHAGSQSGAGLPDQLAADRFVVDQADALDLRQQYLQISKLLREIDLEPDAADIGSYQIILDRIEGQAVEDGHAA